MDFYLIQVISGDEAFSECLFRISPTEWENGHDTTKYVPTSIFVLRSGHQETKGSGLATEKEIGAHGDQELEVPNG